jgi:hypothetical protein
MSCQNLDKKVTHLGHLVKDVCKELKQALLNRDLIYVEKKSLELHMSGTHGFIKWFEIVMDFYMNHININNIYVIPHIYSFVVYWSMIDDDIKKKEPQNIVNDQVIRNFLFFFNWIICHSDIIKEVDKSFKIMSMDSEDLNFKAMKESGFIISRDLQTVSKFIKPNDPKEIVLPMSEICELLQRDNIDNKLTNLCYWFSWMFYYERVFHKNKWEVHERSNFTLLEEKFRNNWIVLFLEVLLHYTEPLSVSTKRILTCLIYSYCKLFSAKNKKTFASFILCAMKIMTNPYRMSPIDTSIFCKAYAYSLQCNYHYSKG